MTDVAQDDTTMIECPECEGAMIVQCDYCGGEMDCPTCEGTGEIDKEDVA